MPTIVRVVDLGYGDGADLHLATGEEDHLHPEYRRQAVTAENKIPVVASRRRRERRRRMPPSSWAPSRPSRDCDQASSCTPYRLRADEHRTCPPARPGPGASLPTELHGPIPLTKGIVSHQISDHVPHEVVAVAHLLCQDAADLRTTVHRPRRTGTGMSLQHRWSSRSTRSISADPPGHGKRSSSPGRAGHARYVRRIPRK